MRRTAFSIWTLPVALLVICFLTYGSMITKLGFFWDDWTIAYYIHFLGPSSFREAFTSDRPLLAWIYILTTSLMGENPAHWQVFSVIARWLACIALWWTLKGLWPRKTIQVTAIAFLFAVYPSFQQQFIAITYGNAFLIYALFLASLGAMVWALRKPRWFWSLYLLSIFMAGYTLFTVEYFVGLELLRPALLWVALNDTLNEARKRLRRVGLYWIPYITLGLLFLSWRVLNETPRAKITIFERLSSNPVTTLLELGRTAVQDLAEVTALAWKQTLNFTGILAYDPVTIIKYALIILGAATFTTLFLLYLCAQLESEKPSTLSASKTSEGVHITSPTISPNQAVIARSEATKQSQEHLKNKISSRRTLVITLGSERDRNPKKLTIVSCHRGWAIQSILLGLFALVIAGLPIWMTDLKIALFFPWDRFTIPMIIGASLLLAGLIEMVTWNRIQNAVLVGFAVGVAVGMHFQTALTFRKDWLAQRDFFWQLTWRAPGIQPGTAILTSEMPFPYDWDNSLTAPLNWTYAPDNYSRELQYLIYNVESRLSSGLPELEQDTPIEEIHRITPFNGSTSQSVLVFFRPPGSCVKVIDPVADQHLPDKPRYVKDVLSFSNPDLILVDSIAAAHPPAPLFSPEPEHGWCYYFEKAELARQRGDWQEVARLGDQALSGDKEFFRKNVAELLPFIEGYALTGQWDQAVKLSLQAYQSWENMRTVLCETWERIHLGNNLLQPITLDPQEKSAFDKIQQTLQCSSP